MSNVNALPLQSNRERQGMLDHAVGVERWWHEARQLNDFPYQELSLRLHALRERMARYLDSHSRNSPLLSSEQCDCLLLANLDQLIGRLNVCHPGMDCWADAAHAIEHFFESLRDRLGESDSARSEK